MSHKVLKKLSCVVCQIIVSGYESTNHYFDIINRGGLTVPSFFVMHLGECMFKVTQILISNKYEDMFLKCGIQRELLINITEHIISSEDMYNHDTKCNCGNSKLALFKIVAPTFANILITNYTKIKNDANANRTVNNKKRKLTTFT